MTRRLLALCVTASFATLASAGAAHADPSGFVSVGAGILQRVYESPSDTDTDDGYGGKVRASGVFDFTPVLGVQGDVVLALEHFENPLYEYDRNTVDIALHGFYRDSERFLIGTFAQVGRDTHSFGGPISISWDRGYIGGEAQLYVDDLTLYAQGGAQRIAYDETAGPAFGGLFGSLEARYFLTPDLRIDAHAGLSTLTPETGPSYTMTTLNVGVGAEYRLESLPVSVFATYDYFTRTDDISPNYSVNDHRFMIGAKFGIGEDTLKGRDRTGTSLKPVETVMFGSIN